VQLPACLAAVAQVYCDNPSDSGKVHSSVKQRWLEGDPEVVQGMTQVAGCAEQGRCV
jgi:glucuronokinase